MNEFYESIIKEIKSYKRYGTEFSMMDEFYNSDNDEFSFRRTSQETPQIFSLWDELRFF